jgi:lycopene beta-cyclase
MPWSASGPTMSGEGPLAAGYGGGWFHPATGYSFPMAIRLALAVAQSRPDEVRRAATALAARTHSRRRFARLLNLLLFRAVVPERRWQIFRRLYRDLPDALMARFYAMEFTPLDAARMLIGPPPPLAPLRLLGRLESRPCPLPN